MCAYFNKDSLFKSQVQHCLPSLTLKSETKRSKPGQPPKQVLKQLAATTTEMRSFSNQEARGN